MAEDDANQDFSIEAPEDDEMDFDSSLHVQSVSDLKPRLITAEAEAAPESELKQKKLASDDDIRKLRALFDVPGDVDRKYHY